MKMKAKKLPPSRSPTAFAAATVRSRKIRSGTSGASTRVSTSKKASSDAAETASSVTVRAAPHPTCRALETDRRSRGPDPAPEAERFVAFGSLREHVHHDREGRRQNDGRAESLQPAHRDQEAVARRQPSAERGGREDRQADHQNPPSPEQIR